MLNFYTEIGQISEKVVRKNGDNREYLKPEIEERVKSFIDTVEWKEVQLHTRVKIGSNFDPIEIYELLNFEGIKHIFKYQDLSVNMPLPISNQEINYTISDLKDNVVESNDNKKEILIEIKHRVKRDWEENNFLVNISLFSYMKTYRDFIIMEKIYVFLRYAD